jgi:hypothetical protein
VLCHVMRCSGASCRAEACSAADDIAKERNKSFPWRYRVVLYRAVKGCGMLRCFAACSEVLTIGGPKKTANRFLGRAGVVACGVA